jgi:hypothetical protein
MLSSCHLRRAQGAGSDVGFPRFLFEESVAPAGNSGHRMPFEVKTDSERLLLGTLSEEVSHASITMVMKRPRNLEP